MANMLNFQGERKKMIEDFSNRAQAYHARQQGFELQKLDVEGEINKALLGMKTKAAKELQDDDQEFSKPLQQAQIGNILEEVKGKQFDRQLGMDYSGTFLEQKRNQGNLTNKYFRQMLGVPEEGSVPPLEDNTKSVEPLQELPMPTNFTDYHPMMLLAGAAKKGAKNVDPFMNYLRNHFRMPGQ